MQFKNFVTPKRMEQYANWAPSVICYSIAAFAALVYVTDWKVIADKIPLYNAKFKKQ